MVQSTRQIVIDPVTRIEGHSRITLHLNEQGVVENAFFHVTQFRGFEKFTEGRPFAEMPSLMARICGICPVSHLIASARACDALMAVHVPPTGNKLRRVMNLGQIVQSHALSFFYLSAPDFLLGMDSNPEDRNVFGVLKASPEMARGGVRLRQFGQQVIEILGGKRIHPAWVVPGGVSTPLTEEKRDQILAAIPEVKGIAQRALDWFKSELAASKYESEIETFAAFPTKHMGLVGPDGELEHYKGALRLIDEQGQTLVDNLPLNNYDEYIGEAVEPFTYLKFPYYKPDGYPDGIYRVGPLSRLNIATRAGTPLADEELRAFKAGGQVQSSFHYHYARLIEILYGIEMIEQILDDPDILNPHVRAQAAPNSLEGVGVSEAPRGTLLHHYKINEHGQIIWANLIIATGHNNLAMNRGVLQVAQRFVDGSHLTEGMLNRVEAVIRAFDPCLSCSTHAAGQMPLHIQLLDAEGSVLDQVKR